MARVLQQSLRGHASGCVVSRPVRMAASPRKFLAHGKLFYGGGCGPHRGALLCSHCSDVAQACVCVVNSEAPRLVRRIKRSQAVLLVHATLHLHAHQDEQVLPLSGGPTEMLWRQQPSLRVGRPVHVQGLSSGVVRVDTEEASLGAHVQDVGCVTPECDVHKFSPRGKSRADFLSSDHFLHGNKKHYPACFGCLAQAHSCSWVGSLSVGEQSQLCQADGRPELLRLLLRHPAPPLWPHGMTKNTFEDKRFSRGAKGERIVVPWPSRAHDSTEEDSFQWMSGVLQAIDSIHGVGVFCLALVPANTLPKTPLGGIHLSEIKQLYLEGGLHPYNVLMCPHTCVTNLPKPRQKQPEIGPASVMVGNLVSGKRIAQASGRDLGQTDDNDQSYSCLRVCSAVEIRPRRLVLYTYSSGVVSSSHLSATGCTVGGTSAGERNSPGDRGSDYPTRSDAVRTAFLDLTNSNPNTPPLSHCRCPTMPLEPSVGD
ncbi:disco-interacting protein 2 homolog C-like isoform X2 [Lates japonicus]|uniref:Disco-interacting protein 2 homolog C-like isoform X2 n=1 Tax=Lates japonicus TaxID=270547 RepID=A0AAD3MGY1_LATJO|nr:disco-interacting protein 2 homolog C-like isoform X2 [Lates japonicus]